MAAVINGINSVHRPNAHLEIRYVSRLPNTRETSSSHSRRSLTNSMITATILDIGDSWRISASIPNLSSQPRQQTIKVESWPMFAPEDVQLVASASTPRPTAPGQSGRAEVDIPKRDLAEFDESRGVRTLKEGIYMFELKATDDLSVGMGVVKQASVVGSMTWRD